MKSIKYFVIAAAVLLFAGCQVHEIEFSVYLMRVKK